jgi:hypothetical protein
MGNDASKPVLNESNPMFFRDNGAGYSFPKPPKSEGAMDPLVINKGYRHA